MDNAGFTSPSEVNVAPGVGLVEQEEQLRIRQQMHGEWNDGPSPTEYANGNQNDESSQRQMEQQQLVNVSGTEGDKSSASNEEGQERLGDHLQDTSRPIIDGWVLPKPSDAVSPAVRQLVNRLVDKIMPVTTELSDPTFMRAMK